MTIKGDKDRPVPGLPLTKKFKRKGITNPAVFPCNPNKLLIFGRLIYGDEHGDNSAIVRYDAKLNDEGFVEVLEDTERAIFIPEEPYGYRGVEDLRFATTPGEDVVHAFLVHYDGYNARTEYIRNEGDLEDSLSWHSFGVWFPNIAAEESINLVPVRRYKEKWGYVHKTNIIKSKAKGNLFTPKTPFYLDTKDCSIWPKKILVDGEEHYGVLIRLLPDIQIVYVKDFLELAKHEFWQKVVKNIDNFSLLRQEYDWEKSHIGLAGQPVEIEEGTLIFYHGAIIKPKMKYVLGVALADSDNPQKIIARTYKPLIKPEELWELEQGVICHEGVVFPTSHFLSSDKKFITHFYGASDKSIGYVSTSLEDILARME
ncbi:MAG: hypothetical protein KKG60_03170 [Nanoarchaeota archaeon]|nr:hypothetical protein [Nanoarchaeota archaeon]